MNKDEIVLEIVPMNIPKLENIPTEIWNAFIATLYEKALD